MVEQPHLLASGRNADVYLRGRSSVLKLHRDRYWADREAANHAALEELGLPVPHICGSEEVNGSLGIVFERVSVRSFMNRDWGASPCDDVRHLECMARLHVLIHGYEAPPALDGLKHVTPFGIRFYSRDEAETAALLTGLAAMPDGNRVCHGDFHPGNILGDVASPMVIDWAYATSGDPAADVCRSYLLLKLYFHTNADEQYLESYCRISGLSRQEILAWEPYVVAAGNLIDHRVGANA